jgi:hypothetical protein
MLYHLRCEQKSCGRSARVGRALGWRGNGNDGWVGVAGRAVEAVTLGAVANLVWFHSSLSFARRGWDGSSGLARRWITSWW